MNNRPCFYWFMALLLLGFGCSATPEYGSAVYYEPAPQQASRSVLTAVEDTFILAKIKSKLFSDDLVDQGKIDITVRHGVVFLEGNAQDIYHRRMITDLIQTVDGVIRVENRLGMIHQGTTFVTLETLVRDQIRLTLFNDPELSRYPIAVQATAAQVILSGSVGSLSQKERTAAIAKEYAGDRRVIDQLIVKN